MEPGFLNHTVLDRTVLHHETFYILRKSIADGSSCAVRMKFPRQPGQRVKYLEDASDQDEQANHDQSGEDDGLEDGDRGSGRFLLRRHLDDDLW